MRCVAFTCREFGLPDRLVLEEAQGSRMVSSSFDLGGYATHRVLPADAVVPLPDAEWTVSSSSPMTNLPNGHLTPRRPTWMSAPKDLLALIQLTRQA